MLPIRSSIGVVSLLAILILTAVLLHSFQSDDSLEPHLTSSNPALASPAVSSLILLAPLSSYALVFSDEFDAADGSAPSSSAWNAERGCGLYNGELQCYTQSRRNAHIQHGRLVITARHEPTEVVTDVRETVIVPANASAHQAERRYSVVTQQRRWWNYTSARLTTQEKRVFRFPRVQASIRLPLSTGMWPALWLLGESISSVGWPSCGEVDVLEAVNDEGLVHSTLHWNRHGMRSANISHRQVSASHLPSARLDDAFHVYEVAMEEERVVFLFDAQPFFVVDLRGRPELDAFTRQNFFLILNVAVGGWWPGWDIDTSEMPARMEIDYVRVYERRAGDAGT